VLSFLNIFAFIFFSAMSLGSDHWLARIFSVGVAVIFLNIVTIFNLGMNLEFTFFMGVFTAMLWVGLGTISFYRSRYPVEFLDRLESYLQESDGRESGVTLGDYLSNCKQPTSTN
jgi:hypothetical protein